MEHEFLYEYLRYLKEDLEFFKKDGNRKKVNGIKAVICNDSFSKIEDDYENEEELLNKARELVLRVDEAKRLNPKNELNKNLNEDSTALKRRLSRYEGSLGRIHQYMLHYRAMLRNWKCSYAVVFDNNEVWSINYTRSLRADRIDTHIARFSHLVSDKNYLVVSEYESQDELSKSLILDMKANPMLFGTAIYIVSFEELLDDIMVNIFKYKCNNEGDQLVRIPLKSEKSIVNGVRGIEIEKIYAKCLANRKNYECYMNSISGSKAEERTGTFLPNEYAYIIDFIVADKRIDKSKIIKIETADIGNLKLKPDVYVKINLSDGTSHEVGISIKSTDESTVSFHEKKAEDFISVMGILDETVKNALLAFQAKKAIGKLNKSENKALYDYFSDDVNKMNLIKWAVTGADGEQYRAHYVMTHRYCNDGGKTGIELHTADDYISFIFDNSIGKSFDSGFSWTYKNVIQLKGPVMQE